MAHSIGRLLLLASVLALPGRAARAEDETPRVRSVRPANAVRGEAVDLVIEGKFLHPVEEVTSDRSDVVVQVLKVGNTPNRLNLRLTIAETAPAGPVRISIRTKAGTAVTDKFSVRLRAPTVAKVVPAALARGKEHEVAVHGTHLAVPGTETKVTVPEPLTLTRVPKKTDAKTLVVKVVVPASAPLGPRALSIETVDGTVSAPFVVVASPPVVSGVDPARVARGTASPVKISGENLTGASVTIAVPDAAIRLEPAGEPDATSLGLKITVDAAAAPGPRTLLVATPDGTVSTTLDVFVDPPALTRVVPAGAPRGTQGELVVEGKRIPPRAVPRFVPAEAGLRVEAGAGGAARYAIDSATVPGPRTLVLPLPDGTVVAPFQVTVRPPSIASATPSEVPAGTPTEVAIEGQNLAGCAWSVVPADPAVAVEALAADRVRVSATADARTGPRYLAARNADGVALAIVAVAGSAAAAPVVTSVSPARGTRPGSLVVTVKGLNLLDAGKAPAVRAEGEGGGTIPAEVTASSAVSLTVSLGLAADTKPGAYVLTVATAEGGAAGVVTVVPTPPSITSVAPANVARATAAEVVLSGEGLLEPSGKVGRVSVTRADGTGPLPAEVLEAKADALRVRIAVPADHPPGDLLVSVATVDGGAASVLTVERAPPRIESVSPRRVGVPATAVLRLEGKALANPGGKPPLVAVTRAGSPSAIKPVLVESKPDSLTVRISTAAGTPAGPHLVSVRTADGVAAALFEVVDAPPPTVTKIDTEGAAPGGTVLTRIFGTGLDQATDVTFEGAGVTAVVLPGGSASELHVRITVAPEAPRGPRAFTVVAPGGEGPSGKVVFTVR